MKKERAYSLKDAWMKVVGDFIREKLAKYGFKNGDVEYNNQYPDIRYWFNIYSLFTNIIYSNYLPYEHVSNQHSSTWARNQALIKELEGLIG